MIAMRTERQKTFAALARMRQYGSPDPLMKAPAQWKSTLLWIFICAALSGPMQSVVAVFLLAPVFLSGL
jgi:hypothetical protein